MGKSKKYQSLLVIVIGLLVLHFIFKMEAFLYAAVITGLATLIIPPLGDLVVWAWMKLAEGLGWINSRILLSVIFYVLLFPIAFLYRISAKNPLQLKNKDKYSVFKERNHLYTKADLENTW